MASLDLVLASTSPYRRALLDRLGIPFRCLSPAVDEDSFKSVGSSPRDLAERLAIAKATSLAEIEPQATLIGSDQVLSFEGKAFGKPGSRDRNIEELAAMAGRPHELITALAVWHQGQIETHTDVTTLHIRTLGLDEIARYVDADHPWHCAGGYKLEERGIVLFDRIESEDHTAITGLPIIALVTILRRLGYPIP